MNSYPRITMVSNYINHHQIPFCEELNRITEGSFVFVQTMEMEQKRIDMGWAVDPHGLDYVCVAYEDETAAREAILGCDILLIGWLEDESIVGEALDNIRSGASDGRNSKKIIIRISERLYREGQWRAISPRGLMNKYRDHIRYNRYPVFLLCNGAYVASDFDLIHAYKGKRFRFGYFPATRFYDNEDELFDKKASLNVIEVNHPEEFPEPLSTMTDNTVEIVWAGRFIPLKHPEYMTDLAYDLCKKGYRFHISMIGSGEMEDELKSKAEELMVEEYISFMGMLAPTQVRDAMEKAHIHIFTSNHLEGWGAVVNEGMNAGCAEVVSSEAGAGLFLIEDGVNGLLYDDDEYGKLLKKVTELFEDPALIEKYGRAAYKTITELWNEKVAAERLIAFYEAYINGEKLKYENGPFSEAAVIKPDFWTKERFSE